VLPEDVLAQELLTRTLSSSKLGTIAYLNRQPHQVLRSFSSVLNSASRHTGDLRQGLF